MAELTNKDIGSDNPEVISTPLAEEGVYPEGYEDAGDNWKGWFDNAARHRNTVKAAINTADSRAGDEPPEPPAKKRTTRAKAAE